MAQHAACSKLSIYLPTYPSIHLSIYRTGQASKHKKRVTCGDWSAENKFAFASEDRQITITTADGKTFGQVKVCQLSYNE